MTEITPEILIQVGMGVTALLIIALALGAKLGRRNERQRHEKSETLRLLKEMRADMSVELNRGFQENRDRLRHIEERLDDRNRRTGALPPADGTGAD